MNPRALVALSLAFAAGPASAARQDGARADRELAPYLVQWQAAHGSEWRLATDAQTGFLEMLYGGRTEATIEPRSDEQFFDLARAALAETYALHAVDAVTLEPVRTLHLPLGLIGSSDKMTVSFRQVVDGVPVEGGSLNVLFDAHGGLLSIQSVALPHLAGFDVRPTIAAPRAVASAIDAFRRQAGARETSVGRPQLVVDQRVVPPNAADPRRDSERRVAQLAWKIDVRAEEPGVEPIGQEWFVDARTGEAYASHRSVHFFDVSGTVTSNATPGLATDNVSNPPTQQPMRFMKVTSGATTTFTDTDGNFTLVGVDAPAPVTVGFSGTYSDVNHATGTDYALTTSLTQPTGNVIQMATSPTEATTAQANAYRCALLVRDFVKSTNPSDTLADFVVVSNVMVANTCNATWSGPATNFYSAGGGCSNFAFSTIVAHEFGHWLNARYGTGNGPDGIGEGNADVWALYTFDTPILGQGLYNGSGFGRTGLNTRTFCGDASPGCYGETHDDGEVWMGAAWKIRTRLDTAYGDTTGDGIANAIFLGWMNAYDQMSIKSIIETQWLTLDDDDGNINNGTPHFAQIDPGFKDQGFPGVTFAQVTLDTVTVLPDTTNQLSNYVVNARAIANQNPPLTSVQLKYRTNGGAFQTVSMANTGGSTYSGQIPAQLATAHVEYYVTATNNAANTAIYPSTSPGAPLDFDVGLAHVLASYSFDAAPDDQGWLHGAYSGVDEWERGEPAGKSGSGWNDPGAACSPAKCWGTDLGNGTGGSYTPNSFTWLRSPTIDCTAAVGTHLRFKRWLSVQASGSDKARILVNGTQIFLNSAAVNLNDGAWQAQDLDISALADNHAAVQIEWSLQANSTTNYGGWNIDDVELVWVQGVPPCSAPTNYCASGPNSTGFGALMSATGSANLSVNNLVLGCAHCPALAPGLFYYGTSAMQTPFGDGFRCVGGSTYRLPIVTTDALGQALHALDLNDMPQAVHAGETWRFQFWYRDTLGGGAGFNLSDGLSVTFCP